MQFIKIGKEQGSVFGGRACMNKCSFGGNLAIMPPKHSGFNAWYTDDEYYRNISNMECDEKLLLVKGRIYKTNLQ